MQCDKLFLNGHFITMTGDKYGLIMNGALASYEGRIVWVGAMADLPTQLLKTPESLDLNKQFVSPCLIDCHTHMVYAGNRHHEFDLRLQGKSYQEIAASGGGILSTVTATRASSFDELFLQSLVRAERFVKEGVGVIEIKSGYGLDFDTEHKILKVAKKLEDVLNIKVIKTFLGAHALPKEYKNNSKEYIDFICKTVIPKLVDEKLIDQVDVFCETIGFDLSDTQKVFETAHHYKLPIKCHAEQLSNMGASKLTAKWGGLSVDHLEYLNESDILALKDADTVPVLLPGAFYFLREKHVPPIDLLRKHGLPMAIATDMNPGTSPINSLLLTMNMACVLFNLTPLEVLKGVTVNAAKALGLTKDYGSIEVGKKTSLAVWDIDQPASLAFQLGTNPCKEILC